MRLLITEVDCYHTYPELQWVIMFSCCWSSIREVNPLVSVVALSLVPLLWEMMIRFGARVAKRVYSCPDEQLRGRGWRGPNDYCSTLILIYLSLSTPVSPSYKLWLSLISQSLCNYFTWCGEGDINLPHTPPSSSFVGWSAGSHGRPQSCCCRLSAALHRISAMPASQV